MSEYHSNTALDPPKVAGMLAEFPSPESLVAAAARVRDAGYRRFDAHSPFPVHGIDRAMGIRPTILPWLVLGAGFAGCAAALLMQWWMNAVDYPLLISGKPLFSLPANIPITFELIVLFSALTAFGGTLVLNQLPQFWHPVFSCERFRRVTADGFFLSIDAKDLKFSISATPEFLQTLGAAAVETCYDPGTGKRFPTAIFWIGAFVTFLALLPPLWISQARSTTSTEPRIHPIQDMAFQPRYMTQAASPLFADGRAMRPAVAGAIRSDVDLPKDDHYDRGQVDGKPATTFPRAVSTAMIQRGQQRFMIYCAACHGLAGEGDGMVAQRAKERLDPNWVKPRNLHDPAARQLPVGQIFQTITNGLTTKGINTMPSYAAQIPIEDRWAIVLYVRALQRTTTATWNDVPEDIRPR
jgi:mono/diheme cytochrome c family protein